MSKTLIFTRDSSMGDGLLKLYISVNGSGECHPITPRDAIRLAAELTAFAWRAEQRKPAPD